MNINLNGKPSDIKRQKEYNKKYRLIVAWKRKMNVFLGLCRICGKETNHYLCDICRDKKNGKRMCKIPFCQNVPPKGKRFCDEHSSYRCYYQNPSCRVSFNLCKFCGKLFTAKMSNSVTCKICTDNHMQAKTWQSENREKVRESDRKYYNKRKDNIDFKNKLKEIRIKNKPRSDKYFKKYNKTKKRAAAIKENSMKRRLFPGVAERSIKNSMYARLFLSDTYVIEKISRQFKIKKEVITPEMIVINKGIIEYERLTKELNNVVNRKRN